ncbi:MFS transporter, DHA1 family, inner membrane transport protein [Cryobacterium flavum]|uniref:MFS transporter n=1 Tax=Cryobacterium flavum TaxID=1424659 RepID=A0A4R8VI34_9MICO|nr:MULTISPECIES: MFS transporter [Cryobacterium]TFB81557.1 MFS transporter [Cryobacterium flavum]TFD04981.1 MFS transporter [Cryobacterium sp. TMT1-66-1]TFD08338.1 MFS transporter [Cryobacterium sp. TMT1-2-2]SDN56124.1 MFS transporter, DHA1 family, inner membrane transport protein [Cryobacterium flavum]
MPLTPDGSTQLSSTRIRLALLALALGGFGIGATEFVAMGLLPNLAADLLPGLYANAPDAANAQAGWLISAYALGVVVGAPTIAAAAARWPRKQLLLALLTAFTLGTIASALLPTFETVLAARFVAGLPHGAYFGIASLVAAHLMGPGKRARGIAIVLSGLTISNVIGVPTITWIGQMSGWRVAYLVVAAIFALTFAAVAVFVPFQNGNPKATMRAELQAFGKLQVWITLSIGAIGFGGLFAVYTYVAPLVTLITGLKAAAVPLILVVVGLGMTVGNFAGGALADWSVRRTMYISFGVLIIALVTLGLSAQVLAGLLVGMFLVGAAASALSPTIQARLMDVAHESQSLAAALNHSSLNVGNALGAALGGVAIAAGLGYLAPVWIGVGLSGLGVLLTLLTFSIDRRRRRRGHHVPYGTQLIPVVREH